MIWALIDAAQVLYLGSDDDHARKRSTAAKAVSRFSFASVVGEGLVMR